MSAMGAARHCAQGTHRYTLLYDVAVLQDCIAAAVCCCVRVDWSSLVSWGWGVARAADEATAAEPGVCLLHWV